MKTQLLCTFIKKENFHHSVEIIISCNEILFNKLYVLQNENEDNQLMCTYNVEYNEDFMQGIPDTISLHRKKHTNTLYTINALNDLIRELNGGKLDKSFSIDWEKFKNSIIVTNVEGTKKINTRVFDVIKFS